MKKIILCAVLFVALFAPPTLVTAQGLLPGLPSMPGLPSFGMPSNISIGDLSLYAGWASNGGMGSFLAWEYNMSSFYGAAALPISVGSMGTLRLAASATLPSAGKGEAFFLPSGNYLYSLTYDSYWATLEASLDYPIYPGLSAIGGFRWDNWQMIGKDYRAPFPYVPPERQYVTVNAYIPFVGVQYTAGGLKVGAIGLPWVLADSELILDNPLTIYDELSGKSAEGYFFEMFADYGLRIPGSLVAGYDADLSLFGKFSLLEVKTTAHERVWQFGALVLQQEVAYAFRRNMFVVGAKATLNFNLDSLLPF